jgi:hypothetical protein
MTRQAPQTMRLVVRSLDDGSRETITVTPSHPFLRPDNDNGRGILEAVKLDPFGDWSAVKNLKPGDELLSALGHHLVVDAVHLDSTPALVYDLEVEGLHSFAVGDQGAWGHNSANQMNQEIRRGQAPPGVKRVDLPKVPGEQQHAHFSCGSALNIDGTWKHGSRELTNQIKDWLTKWNWTLPR